MSVATALTRLDSTDMLSAEERGAVAPNPHTQPFELLNRSRTPGGLGWLDDVASAGLLLGVLL